jgi:plastocyanin
MVRLGCGLAACLALSAWAPAAFGADGVQRLKYKVGPFKVIPGQNEIDFAPIVERPHVDGYITRIRPDLVYTNGKVPGVDVIHLHHGVWLNLSRPDATADVPERFFWAGEEKTILKLPKGYGYTYRKSDRWLLNHMIHNLTPVPAEVYMTYEIDFIPAASPAAKKMRSARLIWMDVVNGSVYPVFNVRKGAGRNGRYTYPGDDPGAYRGGPKLNEWEVDRDGTLIFAAAHLHPGGLYGDLRLRRRGARIRAARCARKASAASRRRCRRSAPRGRGNRAHLFRSRAKYYEPAGAVSWDVSMTATPADWRVEVRKGDVLSTSSTYDTRRAAWWESMGIMLAFMADGGRGRDPFKTRVNHPGNVTHGHLAENDNHGGRRTRLPDPRKLPGGAVNPGAVEILDFRYGLGDLSLSGAAGRPPVIRAGQTLSFHNGDDPKRVYHSLTSCRAPCNRSTGIAYPIADGPVQFESGTLGSAGPPATGRLEYRTPDDLDPGTYTYFCRIHPFMRGAFRVKK